MADDSLEGLEPLSPLQTYRTDDRIARRIRIVAFSICLPIAIFLGLELCGVEIWPRRADSWEHITYKYHPNNAGTSDLFYNHRATKSEARVLGEFLKQKGTFDNDWPVSVFLTRDEEGLRVAFFVEPHSAFDPQIEPHYTELRREIMADVFPADNVVIDLCDQKVRGGLVPRLEILKTFR